MEEMNHAETETETELAPVSSGYPLGSKLGVMLVVGLTLAIYLLRVDRVIGLMGDDSWYVLLAKALATGHGYTLINSPTPGIVPLYPPAFPFLLSLAWRILPQFPENLWLLKGVSILAMMLVGWFSYRYFVRDRKLPMSIAFGLALATVLCPPLVFLAVSTVMSDCVFMLFLLLTIIAAERCLEAKSSARGLALALLTAALASSAYLSRSIAIALFIAVPLYLLKERLFRSILAFCLGVAIFSGPWMLYVRMHTPTPAQQLEHGGNMTLPYSVQFWERMAGDASSGEVTVADLPWRVWDNCLQVFGRDVSRILTTVLFEALRDPYKEAEYLMGIQQQGIYVNHGDMLWLSFLLSFFVFVGFVRAIRERITCAELAIPLIFGVIVLWPFETVRYVLPLAPFVIFYFATGLVSTQKYLTVKFGKSFFPSEWAWAGMALVVVLGLHLYGNFRSALTSASGGTQWESKYIETEKVLKRIEQVAAKTDVIVSSNPALVHLYSGHKAVNWDRPSMRWEVWKKMNVRYLAWFLVYPQPPNRNETKFKTIYMSNEGSYFRIVDLGPPEQRVNWE